MSDENRNNRKPTKEEEKFETELKKLKMSAEFGATFSEEEQENTEETEETEEEFLERMRDFEEGIHNTVEREMSEELGFLPFPQGVRPD